MRGEPCARVVDDHQSLRQAFTSGREMGSRATIARRYRITAEERKARAERYSGR